MINGQSLVGLSHQDAVALLRSAEGLVYLVVASRVGNIHRGYPVSGRLALASCGDEH